MRKCLARFDRLYKGTWRRNPPPGCVHGHTVVLICQSDAYTTLLGCQQHGQVLSNPHQSPPNQGSSMNRWMQCTRACGGVAHHPRTGPTAHINLLKHFTLRLPDSHACLIPSTLSVLIACHACLAQTVQ